MMVEGDYLPRCGSGWRAGAEALAASFAEEIVEGRLGLVRG